MFKKNKEVMFRTVQDVNVFNKLGAELFTKLQVILPRVITVPVPEMFEEIEQFEKLIDDVREQFTYKKESQLLEKKLGRNEIENRQQELYDFMISKKFAKKGNKEKQKTFASWAVLYFIILFEDSDNKTVWSFKDKAFNYFEEIALDVNVKLNDKFWILFQKFLSDAGFVITISCDTLPFYKDIEHAIENNSEFYVTTSAK